MSELEFEKQAAQEAERIRKILSDIGISDSRIQIMEPVIINTSWMKAKLDDAREKIKESPVAISYNNGGGQKGIRENPLFKGYEALWKSYMQGMKVILDGLPEEAVEIKKQEMEKPRNMLELVRERKRA